MASAPLDTLVFTYGTLKRGFLNYDYYLRPSVQLGKAEYLGDGITTDPAFCLVLRKERQVPCLYRATERETGYCVPGELFRVDANALAALDLLEGVDEASYYREEIEIELTSDDPTGTLTKGQRVKCQIYLKTFSEKLVELENVPEYTQAHHVAYKSRKGTPKLRILECIYGTDVARSVQEKLDSGVTFDAAWKQVVGAEVGGAEQSIVESTA